MSELTVSVTELNEYVRGKLNMDPMLKRIQVRGEIGEYRVQAGSGHAYFTLKDEGAVISCTMWRANVSLLRFLPKTGTKVTAKGQVSLYVAGGKYQLMVDSMTQDGQGDLFRRFEELKMRLQLEGLFDQSAKKPIPLKVSTIGVATSLSGAAVRDIIKVAHARNPRVNIILAPCAVQGRGAEFEIARSVEALDKDGRAEVILVGRGGGSMEDLWAFNEEAVARAIYRCRTPVISCVGHETDFTIADFAADLRAATPSNAAELAVADVHELEAQLRSLRTRLDQSVKSAQEKRRLRLQALMRCRAFSAPRETFILQRNETLANQKARLDGAVKKRLSDERIKTEGIMRVLRSLDPDNIKKRGYACVRLDGRIVSSIKDINTYDLVSVEMLGGEFDAGVKAVRRKRS
ncbi:MAG: exodeoxyribonuclease VII large subunit [Clostridia bacterium]|nr:exodeoxyribonuclease VII large subunit [Clostridia bacterium]